MDTLLRVTGPWSPRTAEESDIPAIEALIPLSVHGLQGSFYSEAQRTAAIGGVFAVDRQLIRDASYFVVEDAGVVVGCGGWSRRRSLCGGDGGRELPDPEIDPASEPARIRAFFVHPAWARRGVGRSLLVACERAIVRAGFRSVTIAATLSGQYLYSSFGYKVTGTFAAELPGGLELPCVSMARELVSPVESVQQPAAKGQ
jgi:GNAT superfamily N-acetyltransferase